MDEILTIAAIESRFVAEWVLVEDPETNELLPRQGGKVRFHKDGYTDLRGRFDFASLSGPNRTGAQQYAILVLSESDGAVIREVDAPVQ